MEQLLFSLPEAAGLLSVSIRKIQYAIANGELRPRRFGRRVLLSARELRRFADGDRPGRQVREGDEAPGSTEAHG